MFNFNVFLDVSDLCVNNDGSFDLVGVRTDCIKLPFSIEVIPAHNEKSGSICDRKEWQECMSDVVGPFVAVLASNIRGVRLVWKSTDMHMMDGLCSARAGGGVHAEVICAFNKI